MPEDSSYTSEVSQKDTESIFLELFKDNQKKVLSLARQITGNYHLGEDITQEVFLRLYRCLQKGIVIKEAWVMRATINVALNVKKYEKVRGVLPLDDEILEDRRDNPREDMEKAEKMRTVAEAISTLPERQKISLTLRCYDNRSYAEIAKVLNCKPKSARKNVERAKVYLRKAIYQKIRESDKHRVFRQ